MAAIIVCDVDGCDGEGQYSSGCSAGRGGDDRRGPAGDDHQDQGAICASCGRLLSFQGV